MVIKKIYAWITLFIYITGLLLFIQFYVFKIKQVNEYDIAIINGVIHDGTKNGKSYFGGIGIKGDKITGIWKGKSWIKPKASIIIDADGEDIAPGFIDTHSHADLSISDSDIGKVKADNFVSQGITTLIVGNCGNSHTDIPAFIKKYSKRKSNINIATLIGLNTVRKEVMNESSAPASGSQIKKMTEVIRIAMNAGALGVSTGLAYPPGIIASKTEIKAQLKAAKEYGGIHTTHMRSEGGKIAEAVNEVIELSKSCGIPLLISHYKVTGIKNSPQFNQTEQAINNARKKGMKIFVDYYPYEASSTNLNIFLPDWYLALGNKKKFQTIEIPAERSKLIVGIKEILYREGFSDFKFASVSYYLPNREWQGKNIGEIANLQTKKNISTLDEQIDVFLEIEKHGGAQLIYNNISSDVMSRIPQEEENMVGTDSAIRNENANYLPHPRGFGTFPRFIKIFVNEKKLLSLDEAIYRMSGLPSKVFKLNKRGRIKEGNFADIVVFDSKSIRDMATYKEPYKKASGIYYVLINGKIVLGDGEDKVEHKTNNMGIIGNQYPGVFIKRDAI
jgi:N-acyl-D-amino-acid deacylase